MHDTHKCARSDWIALLNLAAYVIATFAIAARLEVHYYDTSEYLVAALSLTDDRLAYPPHRSLLFGILLLPLTLIPPETALYTRAPYLLAVALTTVFLWIFYRWLRMTFAPRMAALGLLLLTLNPLVIHYGPFLMHDLPAALAFTVVAIGYSRCERKSPSRANSGPESETQSAPTWYALTGISAAILSLMRYNFLIMIAVFVVAEIIDFRGACPRRLLTKRFWFWLVAFPVLAHFATLTTAFAVKFHSWDVAWSTVRKIFHDHPTFAAFADTDVWYELARYVPEMLSWPLTMIFFFGLAAAIGRRETADRFCIASLIVFFGVHAAIVKHNECRYLIPILPAIYYLTLLGMEQIVKESGALGQRLVHLGFGNVGKADILGKRFVIGFLTMLLVCPGIYAFKEWRRFRDPIFTTPYHQRILAYIRDHATNDAPLYFSGYMAPLYPRDYFHYRFDDFFSIFHFEVPQIYAFTRRVPKLLDKIADAMRPETLLLELAQQQAMVVRLFTYKTNCLNLPPRPPPITVVRYRFQEFPVASAPSDHGPGAVVQREGNSKVRLTNANVDESAAMVYQRDGRGDWQPLTLVERGPHYVVVQSANETRGDLGIAYVQSTVFTPPE